MLPLGVIAGVLFAGSSLAGSVLRLSPEGPGPMPWRVAGPLGFTVDAASSPDSGGQAIDLYLRFSPATLRTLIAGDSISGRVKITAELRSGYGVRRQQAEQVLDVFPADTLNDFGEVVLLRFTSRGGPQKLKVRVEDLKPRAAKLPRLGRSARVGEVSGEFELAAAQQGRLLSEPEFVWEERGAASGPFLRMGRAMIPNPDRLYGLYSTDLTVAFSAMAPAERAWHWKVRVLDERQDSQASAESTEVASPRLEASARLDLSHLPAGGYDLELTAWQEGDAKPLMRKARFSVAWQPETWGRAPGELQDIVHFLLNAEEEERFSRLQPGEQERWLENYWLRRDPTPGTALNETRQAFLKRIEIANARFGRAGLEPGMFSDMGRVFIRYGEPSDIQRQVIPAGDETLRQIVDELSYDENREVGGVHPQGLGGDMRPYEVWIYEGVIPTPIEADPEFANHVRHKRLVFLFVDDHGLGDFRMRYSNE